MRKIRLWIDAGLEKIMEFDDSTTDEQLYEEAKIFLIDNVAFGWSEVEND